MHILTYMNNTTTTTESDKVHPFERAGLGVAPFKFVGWHESKFQAHPGAPVKAGSSCDYCPQAIMIVCVIEDAHGKRFKVGCDCARKAGGAKLVARVEKAMTEREREIRKARSEKRRTQRRAKPASQAQIDYARKLGATDADLEEATIDTCSALIERLRFAK
jgi:hypothetical protein